VVVVVVWKVGGLGGGVVVGWIGGCLVEGLGLGLLDWIGGRHF